MDELAFKNKSVVLMDDLIFQVPSVEEFLINRTMIRIFGLYYVTTVNVTNVRCLMFIFSIVVT